MIIELKSVENARDLGGIKTMDNRTVKENMLFRSEALININQKDKKVLKDRGLSQIIDLRGMDEAKDNQDKTIRGVSNTIIPIYNDSVKTDGNEENKINPADFVDHFKKDPRCLYKHMLTCYVKFVSDDYSLKQYKKFLDLVLENDGATLYHCAQGKDRTGFATILLYEILGVSRKEIYNDYLLSNTYLYSFTKKVKEMLSLLIAKAGLPQDDETADTIMKDLVVCEDYIDLVYKFAEDVSGSMLEYIKEYIGIDDEYISRFRNKFLA